MNESHAIALCLKHADPQGFEYLVDKYRREAMFHARIFLGNDADSADACQESFAKAFAAIRKLKFMDNFYPWFYRILKNTCLNMISRRSTSQKYLQTRKKQTDIFLRVKSPAFLAEKEEEQELVWQVLETLKSDHREILVLKYIQELAYAEISKILSIPRGTVMSRLYNARKAFKDNFLKLDTDAWKSSSDKEVRT